MNTQAILLLNAMQLNATNNNDYFIDITNLGLHNKDFTLVTQASILVIYIFFTVIEYKTCTVSGYTLTTFPNAILATTAATKSKGKSNNKKQQTSLVHIQ